jgi:hypothetical protein
VNKSTAFAVRGKITRRGIFETLNNGLYLRQSSVVRSHLVIRASSRRLRKRTVFPEPLYPTINVRGVWN